jgi:uncharacterized protein (TIGR03437 family)
VHEFQVTTPEGRSNVVNASEAELAPALFTFSQIANGTRYVAAVHADGTCASWSGVLPGLTASPARAGDTIMLFGTGFGPTIPANAVGQLVNPAPLANPVTLTIGGVTATIRFAGIVGPGLYPFNAVVPNLLDLAPTSVQIGDTSSQAGVFLPVQP